MHFSSVAALALLGLTNAITVPSCGAGKDACPEEYPCCSLEGTCGNGYVCLGGCDPRFSHSPGSCVAMPIYPSGEYKFQGTNDISTYSDYLGDAEKSTWSYLGNITAGDNNSLRVQMYQGGSGSTVYSSYYLWYGKVSAKLKTSGGPGVISDIILLSNVKDEVDYEYVGYDTNHAQTNYYWHGLEDYHNMVQAPVSSDSMNNYHDYTIDWQYDQVIWSIDGNVVRTLKREDTKNQTTGEYAFPQTPCRIEFGLWPGGDSAAQGTSEWAGGRIQWNSGQGANPGYFFLEIESIDVQPYDPPSGVNKSGSKSYIYTSKNGMEKDIAITDDDYVLKATDGTGDDLDGPYGHQSSSSSSSAAPSSTAQSSSKASSSAAPSSSAATSSSAESSSSAKPSSSAASSSAESSAEASSSAKPSTSAAGADASASSTGSASASSSKASSASSSAPASSTADKSNGAGQIAVPAIAAFIPALLL